ncbi:tigger transposable element-derived protein 6 [Trichonephila clavipes]|nr:tigger transposable element-derived protein 6 [Trichonephila clavipes]
MDASEKITPLVIGKSAKHRCFMGINSFPTKYRSNKKAWMTTELFNEWLVSLNSDMKREKRHIPLFLDNSIPEQDLTFDDYVLVDTDIAVWGALSDAKIVALVNNNTESDEDESEELTPVTLSEAKVTLNKLRNFSLQNHDDADILQASFVLEKSIEKVGLNALKQKKITDLFDKKD